MDLPPIPISKESLAEFKAIWRAKHGEVLTDDQAAEMAGRLLRVLSIVFRLPDPSDEPSEVRTASRLTNRSGGPYDNHPDQ
jgi:hypothetical protein